MIHSLLFLFKVGLIVLGIVVVTSHQGSVAIEWETYALKTSTSVLALFILGVAVSVYFFGNLYWHMRRLPSSISRFFKIRTLATLENTLKLALESYEAGDVRSLKKDLYRLSDLVQEPVLRSYFQGKVERLKESNKVEEIFTELTNLRDGKFIGNRELADLAIQAKEYEKAFAYALKAVEAHKKSPWGLRTLLSLYLLQKNYDEAETILTRAERARVFTRKVSNQIQAGIWYKKALSESNTNAQTRLLEKAVDWHPGLNPAVLSLAMIYVNGGKFSPAQHIIEDAWRLNPSFEMIPFYVASTKDDLEKAKLVEALIKKNPNHQLSLECLAHAYLQANLWGKARDILSKIPYNQVRISTCKLWADLELSEYKDTTKAQSWYEKMISAKPNSNWTCSNCRTQHEKWNPVCDNCLNLNTID